MAYVQRTYHSEIRRIEIPGAARKAEPPAKFISSTRSDLFPQFSPDGRRVVFDSYRSGAEEIWTSDADGGNLVQLTSLGGATIAGPPGWSPDNRRLAFAANIEGHYEVYVIDASGGEPHRLTFSTNSGNPSWSHDGKWIYFDSPARPPVNIYKVSAEGGAAVLVRRSHGENCWAPRESPDGKYIYCIQDTPEGHGLARVPMAGGATKLVLRSIYCWWYALVEDGIYFISDRDRESSYSIQFLNTKTGNIQRIASAENPLWCTTVSPDRRWLLYGQTDSAHSNLMLVENFH